MKPKAKLLPPLHPNAGLEVDYRKRLDKLIEEMHRSIMWWVSAAYKANEPVMAADDALPADVLRKTMAGLSKRWTDRFDEGAQELAAYFAKAAAQRSDVQLRAILKKAGFAVKFAPTKAMRDVIKATLNQQVSLIKSIPAQYLTQVESSVMRSVQAGRDIGGLAKELETHFGVTKRRASFIARSQNNIATSMMNRARQTELGITQARWVHSAGGKEPRPSHVAAGKEGAVYDVAKGWYDPDASVWTWPGVLPNCRCVSRSIIPGFV